MQSLRERVDFIHEHVKTDALVEEYIDGRELYIGVLGNTRLTTLPVWEIDFGTLHARPGAHRDSKSQVGPQLPSASTVSRRMPRARPAAGGKRHLGHLAKRVYRALYT